MKKSMHKIIVPTLAICLGAALAGSISGTVAWYQYSTRVSTAYLGTTAGTAGNLKLRIKGTNDWLNSLSKEAIEDYLTDEDIGQDIIPITAGNIGEDDELKVYNAGTAQQPNNKPLFFKNPIRGFEERVDYNSDSWLKADESMYVQIPLEVAFIEFDGVKKGEEDKEYLEKDVYISDLLIQEDWQNAGNEKKDLSSAIRVHISSSFKEKENEQMVEKSVNKLISKNGGSILTEGYLDLDGDTVDDEFIDGDRAAHYGFGNSSSIAANTKKVIYGEGAQTAYVADTDIVANHTYKDLAGDDVADPIYPAVVKSVNDSLVLNEEDFEFQKGNDTASKRIGRTIGYDKTSANWEQEYLNITLTIWLEGWQTLPISSNSTEESAIWNAADYIGSMFDVGIQFAVQAE